MARATKSFTLRMPEEVYNELEKQAGEGKRSEFVLELLRRELGFSVEPKPISAKVDSEFSVDLELRFENLKTVQDKVLQRLAEIEKWVDSQKAVPQDESKTNSKTLKDTGISKTDSKTVPDNNQPRKDEDNNSKTNSKTKSYSKKAENLSLDIKIPRHIPDSAKSISTSELRVVFRSAGVDAKYAGDKLTNYRKWSKANQWHKAGHFAFKYSHERDDLPSGSKDKHVWLICPYHDIKNSSGSVGVS